MKFLNKLLSMIIVLSTLFSGSILPISATTVSNNNDMPGELVQYEENKNPKTTFFDEAYLHAEDLALSEESMILQYIDSSQFYAAKHTQRLPELEDLNTYVFANNDGTRSIYIMHENVKYIDKDGTIKEKDISLKNEADGFGVVQSDIELFIPTNPVSGIDFEYSGFAIKLIPQDLISASQATQSNNSIIYSEAYGVNTKLVYTPMLSGVKEDIVLTDYTENTTYTFILQTDGLNIYNNNSGYYLASNDKANPIFYLNEIYIYDAVGNPDIGTMTVETISEGQEYLLTIIADDSFLSNSNTVYPVTIDPSITVSDSITNGSIIDAPIFEGYSDRNFGTYLYDRVGTPSEAYGVGRTVVKLSGLISSTEYQNITANQITNVIFYAKEASGGTTQYINLYPLTSNTTWTETSVTWNNIGSYTTSVNYGNTMYNGQWTAFDITNLVKAWKIETYSADAGFIMTNENETNNKCFYSSEYSTVSYRPYVIMTYQPEFCGGDSFDDAEIITLNTYHTVNIDTPNKLKYFKFVPTSTGFYTFECTYKLSGDPYGRLYNSSEGQIAYNDDGASNLKFRLTYHLMSGITYYFTAGCYGTTTGIYDFKIVETTTSSHISASTLSVGSQPSVSNDLPYKAKFYKFTPSVTEEYLFVSSDNTGDPRIWLYNSSLNQVGYNDDGASNHNFKLSVTLIAGQTYYIVINQYSNGVGNCKLNFFINADLGQVTATGLYASSAGVVYNFVPQTSGTYNIETERPVGVAEQDTVAYLLDSNYNLISSNDNKDSSGNNYSLITATLTSGQKYKVIITTNSGSLLINCYIAVYKSGSLYAPVSDYAGFVKQFKKIGDYSPFYNCLAYAIGITNSCVWPWSNEPSLSQLDSFMESKGYIRVLQYQSNCVVAYGLSSSQITHFSKVVSNTVTAKCGGLELMEHNEYDAYFAAGNYGSPQAFYVKAPSNMLLAGQSTESIITDSHTIINIDSYLSELNMDVARDIEITFDQLVIDGNILISSYDLVDNNNNSYNAIKNLGNESVPYILNYVIKSDNNGLFEAFLIASVAKMLNYKSLPGCIESNNKYSCEYEDYSPKYYAYQILATFVNNSNE